MPELAAELAAAIVYWNTVYLGHAVQHLRSSGAAVPEDFLRHVAPLGWNNISLTGDYLGTQVTSPGDGFRPAARAKRAERYDGFMQALGRRLAKGPGFIREVSWDIGESGLSMSREAESFTKSPE
ncbi:hypothetical protein MPC4_340052 [Methylocella tundrae]|uniref:Tn3 transposase DDE domain-containing protein n=1 Tax=Methylocella tundrae TaxID=227605 RepID=A0A8B6M9W2_METTU|nr:Tn3 family transposase [Methylocella tundrae]VTZ27601.1 hypothetical protein MPC1_600004 [Methylocella tundrae]VTZ51295.1 hypothetical protein MPC4_340052 [Methylocella tundrae]